MSTSASNVGLTKKQARKRQVKSRVHHYTDGFGNTREFCAEFNRRADALLKRKGAK
ncbi:MAG TPA: hypothetical protein VHF69_14880 [Candidatus Synoicihabitans sp.]|nr:hypothetical protein [Candidatus Synoicihabitans sp.]